MTLIATFPGRSTFQITPRWNTIAGLIVAIAGRYLSSWALIVTFHDGQTITGSNKMQGRTRTDLGRWKVHRAIPVISDVVALN
ncbi:hypothetical protein RMSM_05097 [Rhodopirellula maiorica SM1]|uniref:Uncharacterized protein n=1 Tax=Rhodopirellula maiorica SM1 TaxID=1265738 RepID=M5RF45_9BACT|nr:hypothetical protein RMSM_05097 [Rhodopirellula maiorica SM1]